MTTEQKDMLIQFLKIGFGELQYRVWKGLEDERLKQIVDMFEAYFAESQKVLGHDRVPISTWETYSSAKRRLEFVGL